jgi:hypothetical protein
MQVVVVVEHITAQVAVAVTVAALVQTAAEPLPVLEQQTLEAVAVVVAILLTMLVPQAADQVL